MRYSVGSDGVRSILRVATIVCRASRGTGRPYTKRILPEHLIPRSPFWSKGLVRLLESGRDGGAGFTEAACAALGCLDPRTAGKHVRYVRAAAQAKLPVLAELLASAPGPSEGLSFPPDTNPLAILCLLWDTFLKTARERSGSLATLALRPLLWLGPGLEAWKRFNRSCIPIPQPP
jgi:hypothetical protein